MYNGCADTNAAKTMRALPHLISALTILLFLMPLRARASTVELTADRMTALSNGDTFIASGNVRISLSPLQLQTDSIVFFAEHGFVDIPGPFVVTTHQLQLLGHSATLFRNGTWNGADMTLRFTHPAHAHCLMAPSVHCHPEGCVLKKATLFLCGQGGSVTIDAAQMTATRNGIIYLQRPVLRIARQPVLAAPALKLVPPDHPGLLAPRLGWTAEDGFNAGPVFHVPINSRLRLQAHAAIRTNAGMDSAIALFSDAHAIEVNHLMDMTRHHARLEAQSAGRMDHMDAALSADIATDRRIADAQFLATDRAMTNTQSRMRWSVYPSDVELTSDLSAVQDFASILPAKPDDYRMDMSVGAVFLPPVARTFSPSLSADVNRSLLTADGVSETRLSLQPGLALPVAAGPFRVRLAASSLHRMNTRDSQSTGHHAIGLSGSADLPLIKTRHGIRRLMVLAADYRITPVQSKKRLPLRTMDDLIMTGHLVTIAMRHSIGKSIAAPAADFNLRYLVTPPGFAAATRHALRAAGTFQFRPFDMQAEVHWPLHRHQPDRAQLQLATQRTDGSSVATGLLFLDATQAFTATSTSPDNPWWYGSIDLPFRQLALTEELRLQLSSMLQLVGGIQIGLLAAPRVVALHYGLAFSDKKRCLQLQLVASHVQTGPAPNVLFLINAAGI